MKYLILLSFIFFSYNSFSCNRPIDGSKVMVFVDTNFSDQEIETAKKAACQRGEKFQVVPRNYTDYSREIRLLEEKRRSLSKCQQNCTDLSNEVNTIQRGIQEKRSQEGSIADLLRKEMDEIKKQGNSKVTNFILSGHDGGGRFGGHKGSITRDELKNVMSSFSDINDVSTLMLLGCYTGVQQEMYAWKGIFPEVRMIGGYDGSAPLSDRPLGHNYLEDLLREESGILEQAGAVKLNRFMEQNIRGLSSMNTAVYAEIKCEENGGDLQGFYYGSETGRRFSPLDSNQCMKNAAEIQELQAKFEKLHSGEVEPPSNPSDESIRSIYERSRRLEHCISVVDADLDVNALFNLRFYRDVKDSFSRFYEKEIKFTDETLRSLDPGFLGNLITEELRKIEQLEEEFNKEMIDLAADPKLFGERLAKNIEDVQQEKSQLEGSLESLFDKINQDFTYRPTPEEDASLAKLKDLDERLFHLNLKRRNAKDISTLKILNSKNIKRRKEALLNAQLSIENTGIWAPTKENLEKFSRKDLRDNLHKIHGLLSSDVLPYNKAMPLRWMKESIERHLISFANPFSWHERSSIVERPSHVVAMELE